MKPSRLAAFFIFFWCLVGAPTLALGADSAVVFLYHRFGEQNLPTTSISLDLFENQLAELTSGPYSVLSLGDIIARFDDGTELPDRTIAITVDDAYRSVYEHGWPMMRERDFPFTLFVTTDPIDQGLPNYLNWDQIREMAAAGVTIGHHGASHPHMIGLTLDEAAADIDAASERFRAELGYVPSLFAYPYGEYSLALRAMVAAKGFNAAFGQYSGVAHSGEDQYTLPRFAINQAYARMGRFRLIANALPIPVHDIAPEDMVLEQNPPFMGFTVSAPIYGLSVLACYPSHMSDAAQLERLGDRRFEIRFDQPFPRGRGRINCTMPGLSGRWHWLGRPVYVR